MSIEERLAAITQTLELVAQMQHESEAKHQALSSAVTKLAASVNTVVDMQAGTLAAVRELAAMIGNHEDRLRKLES